MVLLFVRDVKRKYLIIFTIPYPEGKCPITEAAQSVRLSPDDSHP